MPTNNFTSFAEFLSMSEPDDLMTEEILEKLENSLLGHGNCVVIVKLETGEIAKAISKELPELKRKSVRLAINIMNRLNEAGYSDEPQQEPIEIQTQTQVINKLDNISVTIEKPIENMGLKELIDYCQNNPEMKTEAWVHIKQNRTYLEATRRQKNLAWMVHGVFDAEKTIDTFYQISNPMTTIPLADRSKGERLVDLGFALGVTFVPYINPLDGQLIVGKDKFGIDWSKELDSEIHKACVWGLQTRSEYHPGSTFKDAQDLLNNFANSSWSFLIKAYWAKIDEGDRTALGITIHPQENTKNTKPKGTLRGISNQEVELRRRTTTTQEEYVTSQEEYVSHGLKEVEQALEAFIKTQEHKEEYWEGYIKDMSKGDLNIGSTNYYVQPGIYDNITSKATNVIFLEGVIVLNDLRITGTNTSGKVYMSPTAQTRAVNAVHCSVIKAKTKTWKELGKIAGLD